MPSLISLILGGYYLLFPTILRYLRYSFVGRWRKSDKILEILSRKIKRDCYNELQLVRIFNVKIDFYSFYGYNYSLSRYCTLLLLSNF